ncbi:hypothetical protein BGZ95_010488 [Linnemannia exigua]|uniref:FAD/NAD(P)-binding domain-containing protein n=1 Tax=Linnemannia exigua TaxID=604196 RepID=A0AAD4H6B5_9FUNG|nr:hypothetical protein BGZ95_010488 [Linnemannia exigua]
MSATVTTPRPHVLIVGAGLGGVLLGALLERCNIPYTIFERAAAVKPLGLLEKLAHVGKHLRYSDYISESKETLISLDFMPLEEFSGYPGYIIARPLLYNLIAELVPQHKILFNKRVLTVVEEDDKVRIQTADNSVYEGDILVGADGAYSAVRQRLYEMLKKEGTLPKSDQEDLPFSCTCLVGQTNVVDLDEFPQLKNPDVPFIAALGEDKPYTWTLFATAQNTVCWMVLEHLTKTTSKAALDQRFRTSENSEWGPHAAQAMCEETKHFPIVFGNGSMTLGDLYDRTPKELISKVMLEEKIFKTWHHGRTVLLGDGALTAMHDAIALANLIYALPENSAKEIDNTFREYYEERLPAVTASYKNSQMMSTLLSRGVGGSLALFFAKNLPDWLWRLNIKKKSVARPMCGFLRLVENRGTVPAIVSPSSEKARVLYNKRVGVVAV